MATLLFIRGSKTEGVAKPETGFADIVIMLWSLFYSEILNRWVRFVAYAHHLFHAVNNLAAVAKLVGVPNV